MKAVFKYSIAEGEMQFTIELPDSAKFLSLGLQGGDPFMWFLVDTEEITTEVHMLDVGTGWPIEHESAKFLGTYQKDAFVHHIFELESL